MGGGVAEREIRSCSMGCSSFGMNGRAEREAVVLGVER